MNLHVNAKKIELSSSRSQLFKAQPTDNVTHLFGIAMSIFEIMVIQAKIRHFAYTVSIEEDVACGQITMDNLLLVRRSRQ